MRRSLPDAISSYKGTLRSTAGIKASSSLLDVRLGLECVTPVVGGGVRSGEPDSVDGVRVPGIRGQLRSWWRAVGDERDADALFDNEAHVWGGVSVSAKQAALASRVRITVTDIKRGTVAAAGWHELTPRGRLGALPRWLGDSAFGYALFPLQRKQSDREQAEQRGEKRLATGEVREQLGFVLRVQIEKPTKQSGAGEPSTGRAVDGEVDRLLRAIWAWAHFGGIGARTTRGFGALRVASIDGAGLPEKWRERFRPPEHARLEQWLRDILREIPADHSNGAWTHLDGAGLLVGPPESTPQRAHATMLKALRDFRQGAGVGREQKPDRREGPSYWPEPHMMRRLAEKTLGKTNWEHPPPPAEADQWSAPRAAFGLPIVMQFKDKIDRRANGDIAVGRVRGRWMSPLRLRPLACAGGQFVPLAILLTCRPPEGGRAGVEGNGDSGAAARLDPRLDDKRKPEPQPVRVQSTTGARGPIAHWLGQANGDAVEAFAAWLGHERRFRWLAGASK